MARINDNRIMFRFIAESDEFIPTKQTKSSAGFDIKSAIDLDMKKGETYLIPTGVKIGDAPEDYVLYLHPRSSFRYKLGITGVGVIDADYRDEIKFIATPNRDYSILKGERIGQLVAHKLHDIIDGFVVDIDRSGGLGSTN